MFDHIDPTVFWPLFALACLLVTFIALALFTRYIDRSNPLTRAERRHLRSVTNGKRAMAGEQ